MQRARIQHICEQGVLALLAFVVLWRGGKSLESTWLLVGAGSVCVLIQHWRQPTLSRPLHSIWGLVFLFIVWTALSYITSSTLNYGLDEVLRTGGLGLLLLWFLQREKTGDTEEKRPLQFDERALYTLSILALIVCAVGSAVYILQPVNRFVGTFFDARFHTDYWPNACANFFLLAWPMVFLFSERLTQRFTHPLWVYVPSGIVFGCLFATYSRGALIAFLGQLALFLALLLWSKRSKQVLRTTLRKLISGFVIGLVLFSILNVTRGVFHPVQSVSQKATFTASEGKSSISERASFWKQSAWLTVSNPLFGSGPYSFRFVQPRMQEMVLATSDHPHNVFLKLSAERGIPAVLLFATIVFLALLHGWVHSLRSERVKSFADTHRTAYPLLLVAVSGVIAHSLIDYNLQFVGIALPLWLMLAVLLQKEWKPENRDLSKLYDWSDQLRERRWIPLCIAFLLLAVAVHEGAYLVTSSFGRHAEKRGDTAEALLWYQRSDREIFTRDMRLSAAKIYLDEQRFDLAAATLDRYLSRNREDARAWGLQGHLFAEQEKYDQAIESYETAFELGGWNDLSISRGLLEALFAQSFTQPTSDAAADTKRLDLDPRISELAPQIEQRTRDFANAITQNIHFTALSPNPEEAIKILITLSVLYPEKAEEFKEIIEKIEKHAALERSRIASRPPGWLW